MSAPLCRSVFLKSGSRGDWRKPRPRPWLGGQQGSPRAYLEHVPGTLEALGLAPSAAKRKHRTAVWWRVPLMPALGGQKQGFILVYRIPASLADSVRPRLNQYIKQSFWKVGHMCDLKHRAGRSIREFLIMTPCCLCPDRVAQHGRSRGHGGHHRGHHRCHHRHRSGWHGHPHLPTTAEGAEAASCGGGRGVSEGGEEGWGGGEQRWGARSGPGRRSLRQYKTKTPPEITDVNWGGEERLSLLHEGWVESV